MSEHTTTCVTGCDQPAGGYFLCTRCTQQLVSDLRTVGELVGYLDATIARQTATGTGIGVVSRSAERPLPVNLHAAEVTQDLSNVLGTWCRDVADRTGHSCAVDSTSSAAAYLLEHVSTLRTHPAADELHDEITDAITRGWRTVDRPAQAKFAGPCDECGADLYGRVHAAEIQCRDCGAAYDAEQRRTWLVEQARDQLATASTIARALPALVGTTITPAMIRGYAHRGRLLSKPVDHAGRKRYRVGDVIDVVLSS